MDIKYQVGTTAGEVWRVLNDGRPQTLAQIKKKVNGASDLVTLALGWLAREDRVEITEEKRNFRVQLK